MQELGSFIKAAREHKDITLREAEELSGVSNSYLNQIENGKIQKPSPATLNKISLLYQISYELLLSMAGYPQTGYDFNTGVSSVNKVMLLIVDDSANDRELIQSHLGNDQSKHYAVSEAGTGSEALQVLSTYVPDCILLDYHLPDMDGLEVFERMKSVDSLRDVSVIILTGRGSEETAVRAMRMGAVNYLNKDSMTREKLIAAIGHAVKRKQLRESLRLRSREASPVNDGFGNSVNVIATEILAAAGRIIEKNENFEGDPDMTIILGKSKELQALGTMERGIRPGWEKSPKGALHDYTKK